MGDSELDSLLPWGNFKSLLSVSDVPRSLPAVESHSVAGTLID